MSIRDVIEAHVQAKRLFEVRPDSKDQHKRRAYVTPEIYSHLCGPWVDEGHERRASFLLADFKGFAAGNAVMVVLDGRRHAKAQLARMEHASEEVWEFRHQKPRPGIRASARFASVDCLVAFDLKPRSVPIPWLDGAPLEDSERLHNLLKIECEQRWHQFFPDHEPVRGEDPSEYLTNYTTLS